MTVRMANKQIGRLEMNFGIAHLIKSRNIEIQFETIETTLIAEWQRNSFKQAYRQKLGQTKIAIMFVVWAFSELPAVAEAAYPWCIKTLRSLANVGLRRERGDKE